MAKKPKLVLPAGIAVFPKLNEVDVYQPVDKNGKPSGAVKRQYITYVRYEPEVLAQVQEMIKKAAKDLGADDDAKLPFKKIKAGKDGKEKEIVLKAASGEKYRPAAFDAKLNKLPEGVVIGGGSKIRLDVTVNYYAGFGGGINLYMNGVQVLDLVEGGTRCNFDEAEGFAYEGEGDEETVDHNEGDGPGAFAL